VWDHRRRGSLLLGVGSGARNPLGGPHVDPQPAPVAGGLLFQSLAIGYHHACGVTVDGMGYCWGSGLTGALGDGRPGPLHSEREPIPIEVPGSTRFSSVGSAVNHSCAWAVDPEPTLYCWGGHGSPALVGRGPSPDRLPGPVLLPGPPG
jgi:alpha-tubulin suppressor-like RCC1 family protein